MDSYVIILIWVMIVAVILLSTPMKCVMGDGVKEGFFTYNSYFKNYCSSCGFRTAYSCSKCSNCGLSTNAAGVSQCVPGDSSGPFFNTDTMFYTYNSPYFYYPYSDLYPVIKTRSLVPYDRYRHHEQGPFKWTKKE
jgi:hypothetical protein